MRGLGVLDDATGLGAEAIIGEFGPITSPLLIFAAWQSS